MHKIHSFTQNNNIRLQNCIVRDAVCITGPNWTSLQNVKQTVSEIVPRSFKTALETFHIKYVDDMTDGELLVPKVIVVVHHVVGRLLIDDNTDTGQIDYLYDTLCDTGGNFIASRHTISNEMQYIFVQ